AAGGPPLAGVDRGGRAALSRERSFGYGGQVSGGPSLAVSPLADGRLCATTPAGGGGSEPRYLVVDVRNGQAPGVLRVHLYDLGGEGGLRIAGIQRDGD